MDFLRKRLPAQVGRYLEGVRFPARKEELIGRLERNGVPGPVLASGLWVALHVEGDLGKYLHAGPIHAIDVHVFHRPADRHQQVLQLRVPLVLVIP